MANTNNILTGVKSMNEYKICKVYFSNDGTKPMIIIEREMINGREIKNGQKTLSLKNGYHCRYMVKKRGYLI